MFEAIRNRLVGAWKDLRSRGLVSLFFFELVVVTLGVLLAQGLADWSSQRQAMAQMEDVRDRIRERLGFTYWSAQMYEMALPCMDDRIADIMRIAGSEDYPAPEMLMRPNMPLAAVGEYSDREALLLRERYGDEEFVITQAITRLHQSMIDESLEVGKLWRALMVLDPANGRVREADRVNARRDAAMIRSALYRIEINADFIRFFAEQIALEPVAPVDGGRMPRDCAEIWETNSLMPGSRARQPREPRNEKESS